MFLRLYNCENYAQTRTLYYKFEKIMIKFKMAPKECLIKSSQLSPKRLIYIYQEEYIVPCDVFKYMSIDMCICNAYLLIILITVHYRLSINNVSSEQHTNRPQKLCVLRFASIYNRRQLIASNGDNWLLVLEILRLAVISILYRKQYPIYNKSCSKFKIKIKK